MLEFCEDSCHHLKYNYIHVKVLLICKQVFGNLVNESGNVLRQGAMLKFSDLEVVTQNMVFEVANIDSKSLLFVKLQEYRSEIPNPYLADNILTDVSYFVSM